MILTPFFHSPVLLPEVIDALNIVPGGKYIDATIGGGGYTDKILERGGIVLGIDVDQNAIEHIRRKHQIGKNLFLETGNFADLTKIANKHKFNKIEGIVFDLGMSSFQLDLSGRGFSYRVDEPLDMRMDENKEITAKDLLNKCTKNELYEIFINFAEELNTGSIVQAILSARSLTDGLSTTKELSGVIESALKDGFVDSGTKNNDVIQKTKARIFQALRIAVNDELENLKSTLKQSFCLLDEKGRIAVLAYHSLEDRIVKQNFLAKEDLGIIKILTKKPLRAGWQEIKKNSRAKSARLRIAQKL